MRPGRVPGGLGGDLGQAAAEVVAVPAPRARVLLQQHGFIWEGGGRAEKDTLE